MKKHKRGDVREDGMVFWAVDKTMKSGEFWVTREKFNEKILAEKLRIDVKKKAYAAHPRTHSQGDVRDDGMVFIKYGISCVNFEFWGSLEQYEKCLAYQREYSKKPEYRKRRREKIKKRRNSDHFYKFQFGIRKLIGQSITRNGYTKNSKVYQILGCTYDEFTTHIASQFTEGMTLDNYGTDGWELDHILPVSAANTKEEILRLNHHTNFQPMWVEDNRRKNDKYCPKELAAYLD